MNAEVAAYSWGRDKPEPELEPETGEGQGEGLREGLATGGDLSQWPRTPYRFAGWKRDATGDI